MAKVSYASLKLALDKNVNTFDFNGTQIEVKRYLPIEDKMDLVQIALQKAMNEDGYYDEIKLEMYFNLNIVYLYSNLSFTEKQREDESKIYDCLSCSGLLDLIIANMDQDEYNTIFNFLNDTKNNILSYKTTAAALVHNIIQDLPRNAAAAADIVNSFDPQKYQAVIDFATAANGNRDLKTLQPVE